MKEKVYLQLPTFLRSPQMSMSVTELTHDQLMELKEAYFTQLKETDDSVLGGVLSAEDIPDSVIIHHYEDIVFHDDDFFCSSIRSFQIVLLLQEALESMIEPIPRIVRMDKTTTEGFNLALESGECFHVSVEKL